MNDTETLDHAASNFHDHPCFATADRYIAIAIDHAANMIISMEELKNIHRLVQPYIGIDAMCMIIGELG